MIEILNGLYETVDYHHIKGVRLHHNDEAENYPLHWHTAVEIIMPLQSEYSTEICNIKTTFTEGDIYIIPPGEMHSLFAPPEGERLILLFDYSMINNLMGMDTLMHALHPFMLITKEKDFLLQQQLQSYLLMIEEEYNSQNAYSEASIYALLIRFFVELGRTAINGAERFPNITSTKQQEYVEKFMYICNYISENCSDDLSVDAVASLAGFSKFHFLRLFKQFSGTTFNDYLTNKRVQNAEKLLSHPGLSITDIALKSGFNSLSTFNRIFKIAKNCSPSEYRALKHSKENQMTSSGYHTPSYTMNHN